MLGPTPFQVPPIHTTGPACIPLDPNPFQKPQTNPMAPTAYIDHGVPTQAQDNLVKHRNVVERTVYYCNMQRAEGLCLVCTYDLDYTENGCGCKLYAMNDCSLSHCIYTHPSIEH